MFLVLCSVSCEAFFSAFSNHLFSFFLLQNDMHLNAIAYILLSTPSCHITLFGPHVKQKLVLFLSTDLQLHQLRKHIWVFFFHGVIKGHFLRWVNAFPFSLSLTSPAQVISLFLTFFTLFFNSLICLSWGS